MVNIIELIKKEIIVGPGLIAFAWNPHNQEAEASSVQGHSELHIETRSQKERMAGERTEGGREKGTVEEKNYFQSVLNIEDYIFFKSMDLIKSCVVLFFFSHPECSAFSLHVLLSTPHPSHNPQHRHHFQKLFSIVEYSFQWDSLTSSHVSSP